jgi:ribosome-associated protein
MLGLALRGHQRSTPLNREVAPRAQAGAKPAKKTPAAAKAASPVKTAAKAAPKAAAKSSVKAAPKAAPKPRAKAASKVVDRIAALETLILARLDDDKAQDVVFIDLKGKSAVADGLVVASGRSHRHVGAMADHLLRALKDEGYGRARVEGLPHCDWVLIDTGDIIVHLFRPEVRGFYNIEKIWSVDSAHMTQAAGQVV